MTNLANKFFKFIGVEDTEVEEGDYMQDEYYDDPLNNEDQSSKVVDFPSAGKANRRSTQTSIPSVPAAAQLKMIVYHPISYEDTQNIIDNVKSRKPVIVNMEDLDLDCAQRILDFMAGAVYALRGTIYKISRGIFAIAPEIYDIIGNEEGNVEDGML
jgi:cell division inhibitor SepF